MTDKKAEYMRNHDIFGGWPNMNKVSKKNILVLFDILQRKEKRKKKVH
jgi:hypothetical protein